jgi:hypothetical protein
MNTRTAWSAVSRECARRSLQMELKLEQHAGLWLWPFSLLAVSGLFFHHPTLSAQPTHFLMRSAPLAAGVVWAFLPLLRGTCDHPSGAKNPSRQGGRLSLCLLLGLQQLLICALGGCLALFVLAVVQRNLPWCVASLEISLLLLVSLHETLGAEQRLRLGKTAGYGGRFGRGRFSSGGLLRSAGSTVLVGYGLLQFQGLLG